MTQEQVAQKLFVTRQTVSRWEQDKTLPNVHVLKTLSVLYPVAKKISGMVVSFGKQYVKYNQKALYA